MRLQGRPQGGAPVFSYVKDPKGGIVGSGPQAVDKIINRPGSPGAPGTPGTNGTGTVDGPGTTVVGEFALFDSTDGKLLKRGSGTGYVKATAGVYSVSSTISADDVGDGTTNKAYTNTEKAKLAGIASGATANDTDANLKNRANHTGTQLAATISDFATAADARITAANKEPAIPVGTSAQYRRGDKTWQTLNQDVVPDGTTNKAYTATEKTKLSGVAAGATANSADATLLARANHTGTQSADTLTDGTTNKAFLATERTKLSGIATGATANDTDANLKNRANHTGTQTASTISDFNTAADSRVSSGITTERSATRTLTNARITPRIGTTASSATPSINTDSFDQYNITGLSSAITSWTLSGTPTDGQKLTVRIKDNGTARALAWGGSWRALGTTLPTTTVISKTLYIGAIWNAADSKWDVVAVAQEA